MSGEEEGEAGKLIRPEHEAPSSTSPGSRISIFAREPKHSTLVVLVGGQAEGAVVRFYFHVEDGQSLQDNDGRDLPRLSTARLEAIHYALNLSDLEQGFSGRSKGGAVIVTNQEGEEVFRVPLPTGGRLWTGESEQS